MVSENEADVSKTRTGDNSSGGGRRGRGEKHVARESVHVARAGERELHLPQIWTKFERKLHFSGMMSSNVI